jgi:hypothetical protein
MLFMELDHGSQQQSKSFLNREKQLGAVRELTDIVTAAHAELGNSELTKGSSIISVNCRVEES